ncbi:MAG: CBS protein [uncultured bacterium (gcode 4)]|uniref:CBS protein n=1 Tax=uncultured bacterium (gcode 4) TaxID=1234023 RepID=K2FWD5_9BACT|nr:MAG: CBS protein [uncultured bacterium (gcode 4)]
MDPVSIIIFIALVSLSAFFSGTEIALMSISQHKIISLEKERKAWAKFLKRIKKDNDKLLIAILIWNNLVNVWASALATTASIQLAEKFWLPGSYWIWLATWIVTMILLLFWEITPKTLCSKYSEKVSLMVAPFYFLLIKLLNPLIFIIGLFVKSVSYFFGTDKIHIKMSSEELEAFIDMSHEKWAVEEEEHKKIKWVLDLGDTLAESVMTPRVQMDAVNINITVDMLCEYLLIHSHSRIPVYQETIDKIDHFITFKQAFKLKESWRWNKKLSEIHLDDIIKVPLTQPIDKIFEKLQKSRKHIALVLDEHGWVEWIITLEDIIEEVFWDIKDETDKEDIYLSKLKDGKILASWNVIMDDVLEELKIDDIRDIWLEEEFNWENLSYIITSRLERFAENGETIEFTGKSKNLRLMVKNVSGWKMGQIVVEKF